MLSFIQFYLHLNDLSIEQQSYPKSRKIQTFEKKKTLVITISDQNVILTLNLLRRRLKPMIEMQLLVYLKLIRSTYTFKEFLVPYNKIIIIRYPGSLE